MGTEPTPSRSLGQAVRVLAFMAAGIWTVKAVLLFQRWVAERDVGDSVSVGGVGDGAVVDTLLALVTVAGFWVVVAAIICDLLWRRQRRPKALLKSHGEAYVELPLIWVFPVRYRLAVGSLVALAVIAGANSRVPEPTLFTDPEAFDRARLWAAIAAAAWAPVWATGAIMPWLSERAHARRVEWSQWYRWRPETVTYVEPVRDSDIGEGEGIGWILRTAGLVLAGMLGVIFAIGGLSGVAGGDPAGVLFLVPGAVTTWLVVRAMVRRRPRHRPAPEPAG